MVFFGKIYITFKHIVCMKGSFVFIWSMVMTFLLCGMFAQGYLGLALVGIFTTIYLVWRKRRGSDEFKVNEFSKKVLEDFR